MLEWAMPERWHVQRGYKRGFQLRLQAGLHRCSLRVAARRKAVRAKSVQERRCLFSGDRDRI